MASSPPQYTYTTSSSTAASFEFVPVGNGYTMVQPTPDLARSSSKPQTALRWLDDEVEAVCKLARLAA